MAKPPSCTLDELRRQVAIRDRQIEQYQHARPTARFAYAAHLTKTEQRISRVIYGLHGEDLKEALKIVAPDYEPRS